MLSSSKLLGCVQVLRHGMAQDRHDIDWQPFHATPGDCSGGGDEELENAVPWWVQRTLLLDVPMPVRCLFTRLL